MSMGPEWNAPNDLSSLNETTPSGRRNDLARIQVANYIVDATRLVGISNVNDSTSALGGVSTLFSLAFGAYVSPDDWASLMDKYLIELEALRMAHIGTEHNQQGIDQMQTAAINRLLPILNGVPA